MSDFELGQAAEGSGSGSLTRYVECCRVTYRVDEEKEPQNHHPEICVHCACEQ